MANSIKLKKPPVEKPEMKRAYNRYLELGVERTPQKVADYMSTDIQAIYRWRTMHKWDERVQRFQDEASAKARENLIQEHVSDDEEYIETIGRAIKLWVENRLGSGDNMDTILSLSMSDIRELMKIYNTLKKELRERNSDGATERLAAKIYNELTIEQLKEIKASSGYLPSSSGTSGPGDLHRDSEQATTSRPPQDLGGLPDKPQS